MAEKKPRVTFPPSDEEMIEQLAKMAAQLSGMNPEGRSMTMHGGQTDLDGPAWRLPQFRERAEAAFAALLRQRSPCAMRTIRR